MRSKQTARPRSKQWKKPTTEYDFGFLLVLILLLAIGSIMVFSASAPWSTSLYNNPYHYIIRQGIWIVIGSIGMMVTYRIPYYVYKKYYKIILIISIGLLVAVLVPGVGKVVKGSRRWIGINESMGFQASELSKIGLIIYFAVSLQKDGNKIREWKVLLKYLGIIGLVDVLLYLEPHYSALMLITGVLCVMLFLAGVNLKHIGTLGVIALPALIFIAFREGYRVDRIVSFLDPFKYKMGKGWQIVQSLYAIGSGGFFGLGLGMSRQKYSYIPEAQNDFIFAICCEELGLLGAIVIIGLFVVLIWRGYKIAANARDREGSLMVSGIISLIAMQVLINIGVVTACLPVTGMQLPFISYGGSSLTILMTAMGIVLNVSKYQKVVGAEKNESIDRRRGNSRAH